MKNLKKQLQDRTSVDSSQAGNQTQKPSQDSAAASNKKSEGKSSQENSGTVQELPYTPGVVLKFHCQGRGMTKKELRVRENSSVLLLVCLKKLIDLRRIIYVLRDYVAII